MYRKSAQKLVFCAFFFVYFLCIIEVLQNTTKTHIKGERL